MPGELDDVPFSEIEVLDDDSRRFVSYASVDVVDREGEVVPIEELKGIMPTIMSKGGNIQDKHSNKKVGNILNYRFTTKEVDGEEREALVILGEIDDKTKNDDQVWKKVKTGEYRGMSFGGAAEDSELSTSYSEASRAEVLRDLEGYEFSVVETPANQESTMIMVNEMAKAHSPTAIAKEAGMITEDDESVKSHYVINTPEFTKARDIDFEDEIDKANFPDEDSFRDAHLLKSRDYEKLPIATFKDGEKVLSYPAMKRAYAEIESVEPVPSKKTIEQGREALENLRQENFAEKEALTSDTSGTGNSIFGEDIEPQVAMDLLFGDIPELEDEEKQKELEEIRAEFEDVDKQTVSECIEHKTEQENWRHDRAVAACVNMHKSDDIGKKLAEINESLKRKGDGNTIQEDKMSDEPEQNDNSTPDGEQNSTKEDGGEDLSKEELVQELKQEVLNELQTDEDKEDGTDTEDLAELLADEMGVDMGTAMTALENLDSSDKEEDEDYEEDDEEEDEDMKSEGEETPDTESIKEEVVDEVADNLEKKFEEFSKKFDVEDTPQPNAGGNDVNKSGDDDEDEDSYSELLKGLTNGDVKLSRDEKKQVAKSRMKTDQYTISGQ